jgi:putative FmdB family regulatory protein
VPIYEYKCPKGHVFELFHGIHEPQPEVCPTCGEGPLIRVLHPVAVHFKGSGFYSTDYGRGRKSARDGEKSDKSDSGDKSDKTDKKEPEKKAPAAEAS